MIVKSSCSTKGVVFIHASSSSTGNKGLSFPRPKSRMDTAENSSCEAWQHHTERGASQLEKHVEPHFSIQRVHNMYMYRHVCIYPCIIIYIYIMYLHILMCIYIYVNKKHKHKLMNNKYTKQCCTHYIQTYEAVLTRARSAIHFHVP